MAAVLARVRKSMSTSRLEATLSVVRQNDDGTVTVAYSLPKEFVGQGVHVSVVVDRIDKELDALFERKRKEQSAWHKRGAGGAAGGLDMELLRELDSQRFELEDEYRALFAVPKDGGTGPMVAVSDASSSSSEEVVATLRGWTGRRLTVEKGLARGTVTLGPLPAEEKLTVELHYGCQRSEGNTEQFNLAPIRRLRAQLKTKKFKWVQQLEQAGLGQWVEAFQRHGVRTVEQWARVAEDASEQKRLEVDPGSAALLGELASSLGHLTKAALEQLALENAEMAAEAERLAGKVAALQDGSPFSLGAAVKLKSGGKAGKLGVVAQVVKEGSTVAVRWDDAPDKLETVKTSLLVEDKYALFMSHAQAQAADQVNVLTLLLKKEGIRAWIDMDSERLELVDMCMGIKRADSFVLYLTDTYFERYFCRFEATFARLTNKPLVVVYESDSRHGGNADYVQLVKTATKRFPDFADWLLSTEAIPMARRAYQRKATVAEIVKRANIAPAPRPAGSAAAATKTYSAEHVEAMQDEIDALKDDVNMLWAAIEELRAAQ